ncbi:TonB-dependent receptor domain-containing protein [uncultured Fusobacterium sp.]|uniref:TonB-dependent receptor domain-containing protein n=1 Tax=uncultured Fusobacterium sp. TaxID=159267 RepID=UPI0027DE5CC0|nr:TonB-dependent receptor [uncultured Fusobacterium sp.]
MRRTLMLAAVLAVGTSMTTIAEENIASQRLNETVISTENFETSVLDTAKNVTIVTQEDIQNKGANTVAEALRGVPGLVVRYMDGGKPNFDMRGSGATSNTNTVVLLDGVPLNGINGSYETDQIPVDQIEKIEIVPAGGTVMYGEGAIGGIINIITKSPKDRINYGSVGLEAGSWGTTKGTLSYGTKIGEKFLFDTSYTNYKTDGYRSAYPGYDDGDKRESIWLRGKYLLNDGYIEAKYNHSENDDSFTGALTKKQFEDNPKQIGTSGGIVKDKTDSYLLTYNQKLTENISVLIYGGYSENEGEYNSISSYGPYLSKDRIIQYYSKAQMKYTYGENSYVILGVDYKDGKIEDRKDSSTPDKTKESYAGYILNKTTFGDLQLTQGFRREINKLDSGTAMDKDKFENNSFELAANYLYSNTGSVYLNFAQGFRIPTINDMNLWLGNYDVQKTTTYELGIKDMKGNTNISASVFLIDTDKEIYYNPEGRIPGAAWPGANKNFDGTVRRIGTQLSLQHYFDKLTLRENISYIQPKVTSGEHDGKEFAGVSRWQLNAGVTYNFTEKLLGNIDMYYLGKAYGEDDFSNNYGKVGGYTTFDLNLKCKVNEGLEIYGGIKNLLDKEYSTTVTTSGGYKAYYPADGRSFYAGFKYNF